MDINASYVGYDLYLANEACLMPSSRSTKIESWFSDPTILPRSDHSREVTMSTSPTQWPVDVLQRWSDFIQPGTPVYLFVVQPDPPGGQPDIIAHVIVAQNPPADRFAAIVSVTELLDDPWHPTRFVPCCPTRFHAMNCLIWPASHLIK